MPGGKIDSKGTVNKRKNFFPETSNNGRRERLNIKQKVASIVIVNLDRRFYTYSKKFSIIFEISFVKSKRVNNVKRWLVLFTTCTQRNLHRFRENIASGCEFVLAVSCNLDVIIKKQMGRGSVVSGNHTSMENSRTAACSYRQFTSFIKLV